MNTLRLTGIAVLMCGLLVVVVYVRRMNTENHIFAELARGEDQSPEQEIRLVRELGSHSSEHSTEFLLNVACAPWKPLEPKLSEFWPIGVIATPRERCPIYYSLMKKWEYERPRRRPYNASLALMSAIAP